MKVGDKAWSIEWNGNIEPVSVVKVDSNGKPIAAKFDNSRFITREKIFATKVEALEDEAVYVIEQQAELLDKMGMLSETLRELQGQIYQETV